jgi:DNA-binding response OmpR family regulator
MSKILIIDDSPSLSGFLRDVLTRKGYAVHAALDAGMGLKLFKSQKPDLVFAGVRGRSAEGWDTAGDLRKAGAEVPLVLLVDELSKEAEEKASALGCAGLLHKGLKPEALLQKVLDFCAAKAPLSREGQPATKGRVLIVDDEAVIRTVLARFLKSKGYEAVTAANGKEALEAVKRERPHLMLLDIRMPEMDGFEVLRRLREVDKEIAVMVITANTDLEEARRIMEMGASDYIVKPFHLDYLETSVITKLLMVMA